MKTTSVLALSAAAGVSAQFPGGNGPRLANVTTGGTGPYTAYYFTDPTLVNHTIYQPKNPELVGTKLPVIAWANGACSQGGTDFAGFLAQVASHGAVAIAVGTIEGIPNTNSPSNPGGISIYPERQKAAIDWVVENAGKGNYTHIDATRIAVWGQSCGGLESYANWEDERVTSVGIFHSGLQSANASASIAGKITKPTFLFNGGPSDIAYTNGERDYASLQDCTPGYIANDEKGHGGAFNQLQDAGYFGTAGVAYMQWLLRGNATAGQFFKDGSALRAGFIDEKSQSLDRIVVSPIL